MSIIIPAHNRAGLLSETLDSIFNQSFRDYEVILVDDGSTDGTADLIQKYLKKYPEKLRYVYQEKGGLCKARNRGIEEAGASHIAFLDSDDVAHTDWVNNLYRGFISTAERVMSGHCEGLSPRTYAQKVLVSHGNVGKIPAHRSPSRWLVGANMAFHKSVFDEVGLFDENIFQDRKSVV